MLKTGWKWWLIFFLCPKLISVLKTVTILPFIRHINRKSVQYYFMQLNTMLIKHWPLTSPLKSKYRYHTVEPTQHTEKNILWIWYSSIFQQHMTTNSLPRVYNTIFQRLTKIIFVQNWNMNHIISLLPTGIKIPWNQNYECL